MTQLNLSGRQSNNTQQKPAAEHEDESIKNQTVGALGALAMFAAVIVIGSCSRSSKPVAVQQPLQPTAPVSAPAVTAPARFLRHWWRRQNQSEETPGGNSFLHQSRLRPLTQLSAKLPVEDRKRSTGCIGRPGAAADEFCPSRRSGAGSPGDARQLVSRDGLQICLAERPRVNPGMTSEACAQFAFPEPSTGT